YGDATLEGVVIGYIAVQWLIPAGVLIVLALAVFRLLHVRMLYQRVFLMTVLSWSFLMFSYFHDVMHIEGFWMEQHRWLRRWFVTARRLHSIHHCVINNGGLMDKNFGIGFFFFARVFGTFS